MPQLRASQSYRLPCPLDTGALISNLSWEYSQGHRLPSAGVNAVAVPSHIEM